MTTLHKSSSPVSIRAEYGGRSTATSRKGSIDKFWLRQPRQRTERIGRLLPPIAMLLGFFMVIGGGYWGYATVPKHKYREVWFEDFTSGRTIEQDFNYVIGVGGEGQQTFEWTTDHANNSFIRDGKLFIKPTVTQWPLQEDGNFVNLTAEGKCSHPYSLENCYAYHNASNLQIINPVQSARLTTAGKHDLRFGKVEVRAKLPRGRYIWPAIWFMPTDSEYGIWPQSGELDLVEAHGFDPTEAFSFTGSNCLTGSIHRAPVNLIYLATGPDDKLTSCFPRQSLTESFHTYGMEWTPQGVHYYLDSPLYKIFKQDFKHGPVRDAKMPLIDDKGYPVPNPWFASPLKAAPFDKHFHLIMNIMIGGTNGWFPDDVVDDHAYTNSGGQQWRPYGAMRDFWKAQNTWLPSWGSGEESAMAIDWIRFSELVDSDYWESLPSARLDGAQ